MNLFIKNHYTSLFIKYTNLSILLYVLVELKRRYFALLYYI
jgi:hypothetical protein